jgi:hypothetical protein
MSKILIFVGTTVDHAAKTPHRYLLAITEGENGYIKVTEDKTDSLLGLGFLIREYVSSVGADTVEIKSIKKKEAVNVREGDNTIKYEIEPLDRAEQIELAIGTLQAE